MRTQKPITRRQFLQAASLAAAGLVLTGCQPNSPEALPTLLSPTAQPAAATEVPAFTDQPAAAATASTVKQAAYQVAVEKQTTYDLAGIKAKMAGMLDGLGGLADTIKSGDRVVIKVNLTGGRYFESPAGTLAVETYITHPLVVQAMGEFLLDAGAARLYIADGLASDDSFEQFGYTDVAKALGADLIDLNLPAPYPDFAKAPVGDGSFIYKDFFFNPVLTEMDKFISIAKMKCHYSVGVTLSMKNLIGLTPVEKYKANAEDWWRSALHGDYGPTRLPRVIVDLNRARKIDLAVVDGIKSAEGGEVPRGSFKPVEPGLLVIGKNALATDAVGTALMGFDPLTEYPAVPFLNGENYFNLAYGLGMGSHHLEEIDVVGVSIEEGRFQFAPSTTQAYGASRSVA